MINLAGHPAELRFTLEITRAETGIIETVEMVGNIESVEQTMTEDLTMQKEHE